jgi:hypothetical protein
MRRNSIKHNAVIALTTDPNEIITIVSIGAGSSPFTTRLRLYQALAATDMLL